MFDILTMTGGGFKEGPSWRSFNLVANLIYTRIHGVGLNGKLYYVIGSGLYSYDPATDIVASVGPALPFASVTNTHLFEIGSYFYLFPALTGSTPRLNPYRLLTSLSGGWTEQRSIAASAVTSFAGGSGVVHQGQAKFMFPNDQGSGRLHGFIPGSNTWNTIGSAIPKTFYGSAGLYSSDFYLAGGQSGSTGGPRNKFYKQDLLTYAVTELPFPEQFPNGWTWGSNFALIKDKLYVIGGVSSTNVVQNHLLCYDPVAGTWEDLGEAPPDAPVRFCTLSVLNDKLYLIGERTSSNVLTAKGYEITL